jgi:hypothetical protein
MRNTVAVRAPHGLDPEIEPHAAHHEHTFGGAGVIPARAPK